MPATKVNALHAPDFTSSRTGLSVSDLFDEYSYIQSVRIPYLFSEILGERLTQNREILLKKYQAYVAIHLRGRGVLFHADKRHRWRQGGKRQGSH